MKEFVSPTDEQKDKAAQHFAENEILDEMMEGGAGKANIPLSRLYAIVGSPGAAIPPDVAEAMLRQPHLRSIYRDLLARSALFHIPEAMAASTDELPARTGVGCRIRFEESRAEPNQIYVIVELDSSTDTLPSAIVFCDAENYSASLELTGWRDGVVQTIADKDSDILRLARDPKSTAYLR